MVLRLENFHAHIALTRNDTLKLTLEYPCEDAYRDRVMQALSDILRPAAKLQNGEPPEQFQKNR